MTINRTSPAMFSVQSQKAVYAYFTSKQIIPSDFAEQYCWPEISQTPARPSESVWHTQVSLKCDRACS